MAPESTSGRDDAIENIPPDSDTPRGGEGGTASLSRDGSMMSSTPQLGDGDASPSDGWSDVAFASLGQAAAASGFGIVVASLAVATERRTGSAVVGTVALAVEMWSRAAVSLPAAARANARGRREVIAQAGCIGVLGSLVSFADFYVDSHVLYFLGLALVGVANCVAQQLRFAAAEAVKPGDRPRALSFGVAGGTLAAFIGPEVAKATRASLEKEFAGCFLAMAACYAALVAFTVCIKSAGPRRGVKEEKGAAFTWPHAEFARSAKARKGLAGVTCAWTAMFLAMSAAPLAMTGESEGGHSFDDAATALQLHMVMMFLPGLLGTGDGVKKFGPDVVSIVGYVLYLVCGVFTYAAVPERSTGSVPLWAFYVLLILLGLAWNLTFIAGSALMLPDGAVLDAGASRRVQGAAEAATFAAVGAASAASGALLGAIGWRGLCACIAPFAVGMMWFESSEGIVGAISFSLNRSFGRRSSGGIAEKVGEEEEAASARV